MALKLWELTFQYSKETLHYAEGIIYKAEANLGKLTDGQKIDLLLDNTDMQMDDARNIVKILNS